MPILFAYSNLIDGTWAERLVISFFSLIGFFAFTVSSEKFMFCSLSNSLRVVSLNSTVCLFWPEDWRINGIGVVLLLFVGFLNFKDNKVK